VGCDQPSLVLQHVLADPAAAALPAFGFEREAMIGEARAVATGAASAVFNSGAEGLVEPFRVAIARYNTIGLAITLLIAFAGGASRSCA